MKLLKPKFWDKKEKTIWCFLLLPISFLFELSSTIKKKLVKKNSFTVPIICVGNIYLGGTGKTPLCIELLQSLQKIKNIKPVFIKKNMPHIMMR